MHTAMSTHSAARNFPCCHRYVLHVSQMMWETSRIERCTGSARVRTYSQKPNDAPTAHTSRPKKRMARLVTVPWKKFTSSSEGNWMSASPAKAFTEKRSAVATSHLVFAIREFMPAAVNFEFPAISFEKNGDPWRVAGSRRGHFFEVVRSAIQFKS